MASHAAMLLDPKASQKRARSNGNHINSSSPDPSDLDSMATSASLGRPQTPNGISRNPAPPMAPSGTVLAARALGTATRDSSPRLSSTTSSPAPNDLTPIDSDLAVQFTSVHDDGNESDAKRSFYDISDGEDVVHSGSLIEGVYGVEQRRNQPSKRVRTADETLATTNKPVTISGNTGLRKWMKEGETTPAPTPAASDIVDLTMDIPNTPKDDDDLQVTGSNNLSTQRVCYGKIEGATINASLVPKPQANPLFGDFSHDWPSMKLEVQRQSGQENSRIDVADPSSKIFGVVDGKTAQALCPLLDSPVLPLDITARLDMRRKAPGEVVWGPTSGVYRVSVNLYGQRQHAGVVGRYLGQHNVWLATPNSVEQGIPVFNPHAERRRALAAAAAANNVMRDKQGQNIRTEVRTAEEVNDAVMKMFDQLVTADIPTMDASPSVKTPLLPHQKQALWFMTEKEKPRKFGPKEEDNNSLWRIDYRANGRQQYREIITGIVLDEEPPQSYGGLLADMMGLGKTLSILSLVTASLDESEEWQNTMPHPTLVRQIPGIRNTRTTFLVVPLSAVNNWISQIKEHLDPQSITYYVFHGPSRTTNVDELSNYDLVITTYSTVLSEISGRGSKRGASPLAKMNMFRIVLDEAHTIREQNAAQTKAILGLHSQRRWSVTGTPIQNRLEDLLSVTKFLGLFPYNDRTRFTHHILSPFKTGDPSVLASLRVLVDSFTLRRVKDKIDLPPRADKIVTLSFSEKEEHLHEFFRSESMVMMRVIAGETKTKMGGRMYHHVLKAMMILRQVSAHGKDLLDVEDRERVKGLSVHDAIDLEEGAAEDTAAATDRKAYGMFLLMQESSGDQCAMCNKRLEEPISEAVAVDRKAPMAIFLPCYDVMCPDCFSALKPVFDSQSQTEVNCQVCDGWIPAKYSTITPAGLEEYIAQEQQSRKQGKQFGDYEGPHTKTITLVNNLKEIAAESEQLHGEPPIKSVVFSAWTSHLDLIERALRDQGLNGFTRLDGSMSLAARGKALDIFAQDPSITILLATIGAGGVGLNLTAASRVFVMEPQYNPAAVAQAVDRVHRLGQKRPVETIQFIMKGSIEEKILDLAKKKQQLADMSMNRGKLDKRDVQEARMREYRSLFK
ncbi:hypothetical protein NUU61_008611 [Penicillium alfredii]|uniref:Uncharacterized protein n=1 Tax=Penicillium alfredii TaxID=1506179 RepID=A0A9W9JWW2_9EURO|nr:uncharacterized protein NUU61_008611 [Penicillium alfredii]KAJ5084032.1 hypothetical protein NUU61_008611 [Penicillium alfredii]